MTCGVTAEAERKSRQLARRLARTGVPVVVGGCAAVLRSEQFDGATVEGAGDGGDGVAAVVARALELVGDGEAARARVVGAPAGTRVARPSLALAGPRARRTRFTLKVQDGCGAACTYCAVRLARGRPWSMAVDDAAALVRTAIEDGCGEVVLCGIDLGSYRDPAGHDLAALVARLAGLDGLRRLRLSSIEPGHLTPGLLQALAHPRVARHLHVPLQSADDGVLAGMGRPYTFAAYVETLERVREALPGLAVTTDVIAGFPTEDEPAFARTLNALEPPAGLFARAHVFAYSPRPGTAAAALGRLSAEVVGARVARALAAATAARDAAARATLGAHAEVLLEEFRDGLWRGYSSGYVRYYLAGEGEPGWLVAAMADEPFADGVKGHIA
jgi:threonylcarbamoyladenosine tRNA methylthiotransferase MtaB